jgi:hypothetical protein
VVYQAFLGTADALIVDPFAIHDGRMDEPKFDEDPDGGKCTVSVRSHDQFADFERTTGRHTNPNDQALWFPNDRAFDLWRSSPPSSRSSPGAARCRRGRRSPARSCPDEAAWTSFSELRLMRFQAEPFERWHGEAAPLFRAHWELVGRHKELSRSRSTSSAGSSERAGLITALHRAHAVAPRRLCAVPHRAEPELQGPRVRVLPRDLHRAARARGLKAVRFARFIELLRRRAEAKGCVKSVMHMKLTHDFGRMLARLGYEESERLWEKVL